MGRRNLSDVSDYSLRDVAKEKPLSRYKRGLLIRNPFFNFLRDMKRKSQGMDILEVAIKGAEIWSKMDKAQKKPFYQLARKASRRRRKGRRRRRRRRGRRRRRSYGRTPSPNSKSRSASQSSRMSQWSNKTYYD